MGILSNLLQEEKIIPKELSSTKNLIYSKQDKLEPRPLSLSVRPTLPEDMEELEYAYRKDPICFNAINKTVQIIMAAGYEFNGKGKRKYEEFFDDIGNVGEETTFEELLEGIYLNQLVYGNAYVELVFDKKTDSTILDLLLIDPKRIDYAKDSSDNIVLVNGRPIGYVYKLASGYYAEGDLKPEEVTVKENQIFISAKKICHFKLHTIGDRYYGIGLIEPGYRSILRKMKIEEANTNSIYDRGTYPVIVSVGDEIHEPVPADVERATEVVSKMKFNRYVGLPYWIKPNTLEVKQSDIVQSTLDYLRVNETASLGMPMAFAAGSGEATNRATLNNQQQILELTLNQTVKKTVAQFKKYILGRLSFYNHFGPIPEFTWGDIGAGSIDTKSKRIVEYIKAGVFDPTILLDYIKNLEGMTNL